MPAMFIFRRRDCCPACASTEVRTRYRCSFDSDPIAGFLRSYYRIDTAALASGEYRLDECAACGTMYQAEAGDAALLDALYGEWVGNEGNPENDPGYRFDVANPAKSRDGHEIMAASAFLRIPFKQMGVLDYGMGWASWSRIAAMLGCSAFGSDLAGVRMEFARKHGITPLTDAELGEERFDFINAEQVFEHLTEPAATAERLAKALRPGGVLKISVPSNRGVDALLKRLAAGQATITHGEIMPVHPLEHVNCYTRQGISALGRRFGLEPVTPQFSQRYAFLRHRGSLAVLDPKRLAKELVRPWYQYRNPANHYVWLRKDRQPAAIAR